MKFGRFDVQLEARQLLVDGQPARLGARCFDVLAALLERQGRVVAKGELMDLVWPGLVVEENNLQVHISALRKVLGAVAIATIPGRGYQFTLRPDDAQPQAGPGAVPAPALAHNLPQWRTRFIGRESTLRTCTRLLHGVRLLTFTGIGGCGKTRLALQLAQGEWMHFPGGTWFVDLAPVQEPPRMATALAEALDVREQPGVPLIERLIERLREGRSLLVIDNCEHLIDAVADVADALLRACAGLTIVATSREGLGVDGEQVYSVPPLSLTGADTSAGMESEAVCLFVDRACLVLPDFALDADTQVQVADICRRLDGIALAIELAAARVTMLSVAEISARLDDRFRFLTGGRRALPRHQTLQATLQWSHDSLSVPEQRLFRELAVFAGGAVLAAVRGVAGVPQDHEVLQTLTQLHDKSLLVVDRGGVASPRYRMLETVRQYAQDRLDASGDGTAVRDRHLHFYAALADAALHGLQGPEQSGWLRRIRVEQENLLAAHAWAAQAPDAAVAQLRLAAGLWRYWVASAQLERGHALAHAALAQSARDGETKDPGVTCRALWALGQLAFRMGRYAETLACGDRCLALADALQSTELIAAGLILRGGGLYATGQVDAALPAFERARDMLRPFGPSIGLVGALHGLAEAQRSRGDLATAERCYEEAIGAARALHDPRATAVPLCNLARLLVGAGRFDHAREVLIESLALAATAGLQGLGEQVLDVTAGLCAALGDGLNAARFSGAAQACMRAAGSQRQPPDAAFLAPLLSGAREQLGSAGFTAAEAQGRALSYDMALAMTQAWLRQSAPVAEPGR